MTDTVDSFVRGWASGIRTLANVAEVQAIEAGMQDYARNGWRKVYNGEADPPRDVLLLTASKNDGIQLLRLQPNGEDWRTSTGQPSRAPTHWMPGPNLPEF